jgi:transposase
MDHKVAASPNEPVLHAALELSKNSWLLALQFPDRAPPSLYRIKGGDAETLMAKLTAARDRMTRVSGNTASVVLCYEIGYDGVWLARFLKARGVECVVVDSSSIRVDRRARRPKTDKIDSGMLLRWLIAWSSGERQVWSVVRICTVDEEDLRRSHRERDRLVRERTAHINRIKGLLFAQGIRGINVKKEYKAINVEELVTGDGHRLPPRLASEITREIARLALIHEQIAELERERDEAPTCCETSEKKRAQLLGLNGIGPAIAAVLTREVYYRAFDNRRQLAGFLGLATRPHESGEIARSQGIPRTGRSQVRGTVIQAAWLWVKHQPGSAITRWFMARTAGQSKRIRRIMIVGVARKLAIALWRFLEQGLVPQGAVFARA